MSGPASPIRHVLRPGSFRLILATVVVLCHFSRLAVGLAAVDLFFVLSGYWIYRMFASKYMEADRPAAVFIVSRFLRILPMFLLFNALALMIHQLFHDTSINSLSLLRIVPNVFVIGYASQPAPALVPAWSLDIELQFYLLFPALFLLLRTLHSASAGVALAALALSGVCALCLPQTSWNIVPFAGFFLLGTVGASRGWRPGGRLTAVSALIGLLFLTVIILEPGSRGAALHGVNEAQLGSWNPLMNFALALAFAPLALTSVTERSGTRDKMFADLSYVVYCSHWLAVLFAQHYLAGASRAAKFPVIVAALAGTYSVSLLVLLYLDRPINAWRERLVDGFLHRRPAAFAAARNP